ncbi:PDZ domain-containing protein [bacterium]|nr:PDZ domain-containing protein [bacterium]
MVQEVRLDPQTAARLGLPRRVLYVRDSLLPGGPMAGDLLLAIDGVAVESLPAAFELVDGHRPGDVVVMTVLRDRERSRLTVRLTALVRIVGYLSL